MNDVMRIIKKHECVIHEQEMQLFCIIECGIPKSNLEFCLIQLNNMKGLELSAI